MYAEEAEGFLALLVAETGDDVGLIPCDLKLLVRVDTAIAGKARGETLGDRVVVDMAVLEGDRGYEAGVVGGACCAFVGDRGGDPGPIAIALPPSAPPTW